MTAPPRTADLVPAAVLRRLQLSVTRRLDGLLQGDHLGLLPGPGSEAGDSRVYVAGDDVRRIDWNVTARTTVPHTRDPVADRELETWALVDLSASLDFGTARCEKRDLVLAATAAVGHLTARGGNRMGALVITGEATRRLPPRSGRRAAAALLHTLVTTPRAQPGIGLQGGTDLAAALEQLVRPPRRRGLTVVLSDFLSDSDWGRPLRALAARHDILAVEVVDPRELALPDVGLLTLVDPETGRVHEVQTARQALRERYAAAAAAQRAGISATVRRAGAAHLVLRTDRDWLVDIARFVAARRRGRGALAAPVRARAGRPIAAGPDR